MLKGASVAAAEQAVFNVPAQYGPGDEGVLVVGHGAGDVVGHDDGDVVVDYDDGHVVDHDDGHVVDHDDGNDLAGVC